MMGDRYPGPPDTNKEVMMSTEIKTQVVVFPGAGPAGYSCRFRCADYRSGNRN